MSYCYGSPSSRVVSCRAMSSGIMWCHVVYCDLVTGVVILFLTVCCAPPSTTPPPAPSFLLCRFDSQPHCLCGGVSNKQPVRQFRIAD